MLLQSDRSRDQELKEEVALSGVATVVVKMARSEKKNPLTVSQRSNNLQFSRSPHFNGLPSSQLGTRSIYLYTDPRSISAEGRPAKKQFQPNNVHTVPREDSSPPPPPYTRRAIASLITPYLQQNPSKRTSKNARHPHRLSSSASSIRSVTSSILSRKRKHYYEHPTLAKLPSEILDEIFSYLDQPTLLSLVKVSKRMVEEVAYTLYAQPCFASTYRFAQFVTVVTQNPMLARMVRVLDLSQLGACVEEDVPLAGWREWKYRDSPLHTIHRDDVGKKRITSRPSIMSMKSATSSIVNNSLHPLPSPFLKQYSLSRDVPIGALIHLLTACTYIRKLNFSGVPLAADYSVMHTKSASYTPVAFTGLLFVSDVPKSFTWKEGDTKPLHAAVDLVDAITNLKCLTSLKIKGGLWMTRDAATTLVERCPKLEKVDFRECGMYKGNRWAVNGPRDKVREVLLSEGDVQPTRR